MIMVTEYEKIIFNHHFIMKGKNMCRMNIEMQ